MNTAIITGATQGIGKAIAEQLLANGFRIICCARNQEQLAKVKKQWGQQYENAHILIYAADLGNKEETQKFAAFIFL